MDEPKKGTLLWLMQEIAQYKSALASCAIEGNGFAEKHLKAIEGMDLVDEYKYLKCVFDDLDKRYN